jgi:hypothetical protein
MLANVIERIKDGFGVEFVDYSREGNAVLITSGCGIGMAIMDALPDIRYFVDIDDYRNSSIDWEAIAVMLACAKPSAIFLTGSFSLDSPSVFNPIKQGAINTTVLIYLANDLKHSLAKFINTAHRVLNINRFKRC